MTQPGQCTEERSSQHDLRTRGHHSAGRSGEVGSLVPHVDVEAKERIKSGDDPQTVGELTYALTRPIKAFIRSREKRNFETFALVLGALSSVTKDFYDHIVKPYEDQKVRENGNAWHS